MGAQEISEVPLLDLVDMVAICKSLNMSFQRKMMGWETIWLAVTIWMIPEKYGTTRKVTGLQVVDVNIGD